MKTLVASRFTGLERAYARCVGGVALAELAAAASEESLRVFPPTSWCRSQEANVTVLAALDRDPGWAARLAGAASRDDLDEERLRRLVAQMFMMTWGRRLAAIRLAVACLDAGRITLVSDLPRPLVRAFLPEFDGRVVEAPVRSSLLRAVHAAHAAGRLAARHALRIVRLLRLRALPATLPPSSSGDYVAWLGALPSEVSASGGGALSLLDFLADAVRDGRTTVMVQGARPLAMPDGILHRPHVPPVRTRPAWGPLAAAVSAHVLRALGDGCRAGDFQHTTLLAATTFDVPALRLWMRVDPPVAVMYANHQIGGESAVSLLRHHAPATMVFYSANVAYRPVNVNAPGTRLEPEMRYVAADRLTMWSPEMADAFRSAGYPADRLVETGPIFFGTQGAFTPTSRYAAGTSRGAHEGPVRIGIFDVVVLRPAVRFSEGLGLLTYNARATRDFFADIFTAARDCYGGDVVVVRKMKRVHHPMYADDVDFASLPPVRVEARDPQESLWRLLEQVDVVLCMPFTSVAYLADECGVPAAYYDPAPGAEPSPLGGRVPLVSGRERLKQWLRSPPAPASRLRPRVASSVLDAATATLAQAGNRFSFTETARECPSH